MIKDRRTLEDFEMKVISELPQDPIKNIEIFDALLDFALYLGKIPSENLLEGIEIDIKYARVINGVKGTSEKDSVSVRK